MNSHKIHLIAADMGYGHQRAAYPLLNLSRDGSINLNTYEGIEDWEKAYWLNSQKSYEKISYFKRIPGLGELVFKAMDAFQKIDDFYPRRDLSDLTIQQKIFFKAVKKGVGRKLIETLNREPLPLVTTFFVAAYCAEHYRYQGDIYCITCDADVSRAWAPIDPKNSRIIYLVSNQRVHDRLRLYGVQASNIKITGFPLPIDNLGENDQILKQDLGVRLSILDPIKSFRNSHSELLKNFISLPDEVDRPFTVTFAVGGAGAQRELGALILEKLSPMIKEKKIKLNLVAGSRKDVNAYFNEEIKRLDLLNHSHVQIVYHPQKMEYFRLFNLCLRSTDVLWTKPSELSFYAGLGLPIIMSEPVGSQEVFNRDWLLSIGAGLDSLSPKFVAEWLLDWRLDGRLARAALSAYLNAAHDGVANIEKAIFLNS